MNFREINSAVAEFEVPVEHEKDLEKVILENISIEDIAKELGESLESVAEALSHTEFLQFGEE